MPPDLAFGFAFLFGLPVSGFASVLDRLFALAARAGFCGAAAFAGRFLAFAPVSLCLLVFAAAFFRVCLAIALRLPSVSFFPALRFGEAVWLVFFLDTGFFLAFWSGNG